jgi:hypothetical protein
VSANYWYTKLHCLDFKLSLVLNIVCILLGISPASDCDLPTFRNPLSVLSSEAGFRVLSGWWKESVIFIPGPRLAASWWD